MVEDATQNFLEAIGRQTRKKSPRGPCVEMTLDQAGNCAPFGTMRSLYSVGRVMFSTNLTVSITGLLNLLLDHIHFPTDALLTCPIPNPTSGLQYTPILTRDLDVDQWHRRTRTPAGFNGKDCT